MVFLFHLFTSYFTSGAHQFKNGMLCICCILLHIYDTIKHFAKLQEIVSEGKYFTFYFSN
jgi:hypothetical protein